MWKECAFGKNKKNLPASTLYSICWRRIVGGVGIGAHEI